MGSFIAPFLVGVLCIVLGVSNMKGNIASLHSYHRHRVSEEDRLPFGRLVGLGTILCGVAICVYSIFAAVTVYTNMQFFNIIGIVLLIIGLVIGIILSCYAMIKYNKGIF